ncbi:MAG TPA: hypothetical protein VE631_00095, partial [Alphaproteobacteria bacterium]|nr:hypothetical protein [Alphaproteobacteria bacterium]
MNEVRHPEKAGAAAADPILPWLYEQGLLGAAISTLAQGYCERLAAAGVPILRSFVGLRLLHPLYRGYGYVWRRDTPEVVEETFARNEGFGEDYLNSPILYMREHDLAMLRRRLDRPGEPEFPIYRQFRAEGAIEYLAMTAGFGKGGVADREGQGLMMSWLTDRPGGFREDEHALITRTFPAFALAMRAAVTYHTSVTLAGVYLGREFTVEQGQE